MFNQISNHVKEIDETIKCDILQHNQIKITSTYLDKIDGYSIIGDLHLVINNDELIIYSVFIIIIKNNDTGRTTNLNNNTKLGLATINNILIIIKIFNDIIKNNMDNLTNVLDVVSDNMNNIKNMKEIFLKLINQNVKSARFNISGSSKHI